MKFKNITKTLGMTALAGALALGPIVNTAKALEGYLKYVQPVEGENKAYVEPNTFYKLPGDVNAYTWMEFYQNDGYYGESNFERPLGKGLNAKVQVNHPNDLVGRISVGASAEIPFLPEGTSAKVTVFPIVFDKGGNKIDRRELGYFAKTTLPFGFEASSFGELSEENGGDLKWAYGEIKVERSLGKIGGSDIKLGYNPALRNNGDGNLIPIIEHRLNVSVGF